MPKPEETTVMDTPEARAEAVREYARQTNGTTNHYQHFMPSFRYTDGVQFLAETCGAFWLIDLVASHQPRIRRKLQVIGERDFQVWKVEQLNNGKWRISAWTDTPGAPESTKLAVQRIDFSTFPAPLSGFTFRVIDGVMQLTEEY